MPATEELRVLIKTVADTTGARQTQQALQQVERQKTAARQSQVEPVSPVAITSILQFAGALGIATTAQALFQQTVQAGIQLYASSTQAVRDHERVLRATAAAYGNSASQYQRFAQQLEAQTGFTSDAILEAALSARTLSQNYGLTIQQTQKLITVSADLARVRGIGIAEAFERVQSAIRGEAEASEYLGLTLNDTFLTNQAMNGSLKTTFGTMTDVQKAQVRYNELLRQSAQFSGLAANEANSLDGAFNRAATSAHNFQLALGEVTKPATITGLNTAGGAIKLIAEQLRAIKNISPLELFVLGPASGVAIGAQIVRNREEEENAAKRQLATEAEIARIRQNLPGLNITSDLERGQKALAELNREKAHYASEESKALYTREQQLRNQDEQRLRRLREINDAAAPDDAAMLARMALVDQVQAATRDMALALEHQNDLQRESVQLSAEEARIRLSLLPAQQRMATLQRDITEQQLRARQAALPATEALEDLRYRQQAAELTRTDRNLSREERRTAARELRDLRRAAPGVERAALEAQRGQVPFERAGTRLGIEAQLQDIGAQRALAPITSAQQVNQLQQAIAAGAIEGLGQVLQELAQKLNPQQPMTITVNVTHEDGRITTYTELIEATGQAQLPTIVPQSGVRRG